MRYQCAVCFAAYVSDISTHTHWDLINIFWECHVSTQYIMRCDILVVYVYPLCASGENDQQA